jgi:hypothetical protein
MGSAHDKVNHPHGSAHARQEEGRGGALLLRPALGTAGHRFDRQGFACRSRESACTMCCSTLRRRGYPIRSVHCSLTALCLSVGELKLQCRDSPARSAIGKTRPTRRARWATAARCRTARDAPGKARDAALRSYTDEGIGAGEHNAGTRSTSVGVLALTGTAAWRSSGC